MGKAMSADVNETPPLLSGIQATLPQMSTQEVWWLGCLGRRVIAIRSSARSSSDI